MGTEILIKRRRNVYYYYQKVHSHILPFKGFRNKKDLQN